MKYIIITLLMISTYASSKQVLLLQSYNKGLKWSDDLSKGVEEQLKKYINYELTTQYMDSKKNSSLEYKNIVHQLFLKKLKLQKYDIAIIADNYAIEFVLKYKEELFKNTQLIFCGLDKDLPGINVQEALDSNIPVILENKQVDTNIKFILNNLPLTQELYLINDLTLSSKLINKKFESSIKKINNKIKTKLNLDGNIEKIKKDLLSLPKNSSVLFGSLFINTKKEYIPYYEVSNLIKSSPVPIFSLTDSHFGNGVIGGILSTGYVQGKEAAKQVVSFLENNKIETSKAILAPALWYFDYNILQKYGLEHIKLPKDAYLINTPKDFFDKHRELINTSFLILPFVLISLIILIIAFIMRNRSLKILKVQKRLSEAQLNSLESFIFGIDNKGHIKACNSSFIKFLDKKKSELIGKNIDNVLFFINKLISKKLIFNSEYFEFTYQKRDYLVKNKFIKNENDELEAVTIISDITEKKQADINKQFLIQQSKLTEIGKMLSALIHQWKTPLVELSAIAHKMYYYNKKNKLKSDDIDNFFESIMKQTIFMSETMDSFRGFIKASNKPVIFNINQGIREILDMLKESLIYSNIKVFYINVLDEDIYLLGYPNEFKQVILNLINNAKDSIQENKTCNKILNTGNIKIVLTQIQESVKIKIVDDGVGFKDDFIHNIFQPYYTTKSDGIGIGLYMAKLIIENKMNGKINAYNIEKGAKFIITLPKGKKT